MRTGWIWRAVTLSSLFVITLLCGCDRSARGSARQGARGHQGASTVAYVLTGALLDAYDAATGKRLWRFTSSQPASLPSMTVVDDVVYVSDGDLYALRARDGHQIWRAPIGGGAFVSPLSIVGGIAYVESSGVVYAVNTRDGSLRWRQQVGEGLNALLVTGDTLYVGLGIGGGATALRASDGSQLWQTHAGGGGVDTIYALRLVAGTLYASTTDNRLLALDPGNGRLRWSYQDPTIQALSPPMVVGATIYMAAQTAAATTSTTGSIGVQILERVVALRVSDGSLLWQSQLSIGLPPTAVESGLGPVVGSDGSTLYAVAGPSAGDVVALAAADGSVRWRTPSGDTLLALSGADISTLYTAGMSGIVTMLSASNGTPGWRVTVGQNSPVLELSLADGTLYAATGDGGCAALDPATGRIRWRTQAEGGSVAGAALTSPAIVVANIAP